MGQMFEMEKEVNTLKWQASKAIELRDQVISMRHLLQIGHMYYLPFCNDWGGGHGMWE